MQLEELQHAWLDLDRKLDRSLSLQVELLCQAAVKSARGRLNRLTIWPTIDITLSVAALVLCAALLSNHGPEWRLMLPTGVIAMSAIALLVGSIHQLEMLLRLDWTRPVAEIQTSLESLRLARIRQFKWLMLLAPLVGFCVFVVGLHWLFGWLTEDRVNILESFHPWIVSNYAFGVLFVPLGYLAARVLAKRCHHRAWWQSVLDDISGKSLTAAAQEVERWAALQDEASNHRN